MLDAMKATLALFLAGGLMAAASAQPAVVIEDFEAVAPSVIHSCAGGELAGGTTPEPAPPPYGGASALSVSFYNISVSESGSGGVGLRKPTDVPAGPGTFFNFFLRAAPDRPLTVTLVDDDDGDGAYDVTDDRFAYEVAPDWGEGWQLVSVPLADFAHVGGSDGELDPSSDANGPLIDVCFSVPLGPAEGYDLALDYVAVTEGAALAGEGGAPRPPARSVSIYPNPLSRSDARAVVVYHQPEAATVTLALYDVRGREVARFHEGPLPAGENRISIDVSTISTGTYFVRATGANGKVAAPVTVTR